MSVTVADLLKLPSLKPARVLAGAGGLSRTVAYVSVLEYANPQILEDDLFPGDTYSGSEIVITGFMNNPADQRLQCAVVRRLAEAGEVGLILYYVGVYVPAVPEEMKRIADEKDFVLIQMPEKRMDFRYGEAICEIMERIVRDRMVNPAFVNELLEQVSRLPRHQRTVDTMLKMLSERMMASFLLTDGSLRVLNEATWPHSLGKTLRDFLEAGNLPEPEGETDVCINGSDYRLCRVSVKLDQSRRMELFIFREGEPLSRSAVEQAGDAVRLAANIWSTQHETVAVRELVRAILQDEPMKMRRLANIFRIDVAAIHSMVILHGEQEWNDGNSAAVLQRLSDLLRSYFGTESRTPTRGSWFCSWTARGPWARSGRFRRLWRPVWPERINPAPSPGATTWPIRRRCGRRFCSTANTWRTPGSCSLTRTPTTPGKWSSPGPAA